MRHKVNKHSFGRKQGPKKALMRALVDSLVAHGRIRTTLTKAKEVRRIVEKAITKGKTDSVHTRRILLSRYPNKSTVGSIVDDLSKRFKDRPGGYTRITKLGVRPGDKADMAYIEFVDYKVPEANGDETVKADDQQQAQLEVALARGAKARKARRNIQKESRKRNR